MGEQETADIAGTLETQPMKKTWIFANVTALVLCAAGCDPKDGESVQQGDETTGMDPDPEPGTGGTVDTDSDPDPDPDVDDSGSSTSGDPETDSDDECMFLDCGTDTTVDPGGCSVWDQDCADGEKCMPWANDGGNAWNSSKCTPLDSAPGQPGDPCTVEGSGVSGVDSCDIGAMCWNVDEENAGTCIALCSGSPDAGLCDNPATSCSIFNEGFLPLCLPSCDPLLQNCAEGEACYPTEESFSCAPDASGPELGGYGDPCEYLNACDAGLLCANAAVVPGCEATGCCTEFCDTSVPEPAADCGGVAQGQECVSAFPEGQAQPGYEDVGLCAIPE